MRHHLALVALLALTGSVAYAGPGRRAGRYEKKKKKAVKPPVVEPREIEDEVDDDVEAEAEAEGDDEERETPRRKQLATPRRKPRTESHTRALGGTSRDDDADDDADDADDDEDTAADDVAAAEPADEVDVELTEVAPAKKRKDWHIALGPYLWASAVDADVSLGDASISTGVDFFDIKRHAKYGIEVLAEARYGRFAIYTDFMYGVVGVGGGTDVGPLMVELDGTASSLLVDGLAGYRVFGTEQSLVSFEARAGVRYQRTEISGSVNVAGTDVSPSTYIDAAADALAGAHAVLRPHWRFYVSGEVDHGVFGASTKTWSATADAGVNITRRVQLSIGWRTLTTSRANVSLVMHGPRAALQFLF